MKNKFELIKAFCLIAIVAIVILYYCRPPVSAPPPVRNATPVEPFANSANTLTSPFTHWIAVTPADNTFMATVPRALWIGTGGNITITPLGNGVQVVAAGTTFYNVPSGTILPVRATTVWATGTTASNIVAGW